jgi:hypothetical protein
MLSWFENIGGPTATVLLGATFSAIGAYWISRQQARKNDEISKLNQRIVGQQNEIGTNIKRLVTHLEREGKITKQEADQILKQYLSDDQIFQENVNIEVIRSPEAKEP